MNEWNPKFYCRLWQTKNVASLSAKSKNDCSRFQKLEAWDAWAHFGFTRTKGMGTTINRKGDCDTCPHLGSNRATIWTQAAWRQSPEAEPQPSLPFSVQVGRRLVSSCSLQLKLPKLPTGSICTSALAPGSAISPVVITFSQLASLSWHSCPLLWARFRVDTEWPSPAHADYMPRIWHSVVHFLFPLACWSLNRDILLISLSSDHTKLSTLGPRAAPLSTVSLSAQAFRATPRIYAQADMQRLGNAFIVTAPKSPRNSETGLWLCYYIVCYLGNADNEWQAQSAFHSEYVWTPTGSNVLDRYLATRWQIHWT